MRVNRSKIIDETSGTLDAAFEIMDILCAAIEYYINNDEVSNGHGAGCFRYPGAAINRFLEEEDIAQYIEFDT